MFINYCLKHTYTSLPDPKFDFTVHHIKYKYNVDFSAMAPHLGTSKHCLGKANGGLQVGVLLATTTSFRMENVLTTKSLAAHGILLHSVFRTVREKNDNMAVAKKLLTYMMFSFNMSRPVLSPNIRLK